MDTGKRIVLLDNGSVRAASSLVLRRLAGALSSRIGVLVEGVSLQHSDKVAAAALGGRPAVVWRDYLDGVKASGGSCEVRVLPLFFGPSAAIERRAPAIAQERLGADALISIADPLVKEGDDGALGKLLAGEVYGILDTNGFSEPPIVILVDHGSPSRAVAACRDRVSCQMAEILGGRAAKVVACSMERREGPEYSFCEPLLETVFERLGEEGVREVVLSYLFFSPGRHAGPGGDIEEICAASRFAREGGRIFPCRLVGEMEGLIDLLARRYEEKWKSIPR